MKHGVVAPTPMDYSLDVSEATLSLVSAEPVTTNNHPALNQKTYTSKEITLHYAAYLF